jgi:cobalt-zinc-cadmium resistance protein CzcA
VNPELGPIAPVCEGLFYRVTARKGSALEKKPDIERLRYLRTIQDFVIRPYLKSGIPNTAEIDAIGGYKKEIHINFDPELLNRYGLSIYDLVKKLETLGENSGGGYVEKNNLQVIVRTEASVKG